MGCGQGKVEFGSAGESDVKKADRENRDYQKVMTFLSQVALLKRLPKDQHPLLAAACVLTEFAAGQEVIRQGDAGSEFFVIKSGEANVSVSSNGAAPVKVAVLKVGDYFGENALLRDEPRTATITAHTQLSTLKITREKFQGLGLHEKLHFANRRAVVGGNQRAIQAQEPSPKTLEEEALIADALKDNKNLQMMLNGNLDDERIKQMIGIAWKEQVPAGKDVITEGALVADYFYIVQQGTFQVWVTEQDEEEEEDGGESAPEPKHVSTIVTGGSFGELALMYFAPRAATVKATKDSIVWVMDRTNFKSILMKASEGKIEQYVKYLDNVELLSPLLAGERKAVAQALVEMRYSVGEVVLQQGAVGSTFYILYDGEVGIYKDGTEMAKLAASESGGTAHVFGERALLTNEPRAASVTVTSPVAKVLAMDRGSFDLLLGPLQNIIAKSQNGPRHAMATGQRDQPQATTVKREKILKKDLQRIGLLGCGGFGIVEMWGHKKNGNAYALKGISKGYIVRSGMQESVMNEKNISLMLNSPFIIQLYATYNGSQMVYFLLEAALGGELYATYNRKGLHGSEKHAQFYIAGTIFAFEHCHERRVIYRDLKPENLILTDTGYIKLTDMGLAKFVIGKTYTTCGTPDYFAPEVIASSGHTLAVDWWALGVLLFELLSGAPPFESPSAMQVYGKVLKGIEKVTFPPACQGEVKSLIKGLLQAEPSERTPMRPGGTQNIKEASWYKGFDWKSMEATTLEPPFKPEVKSREEIASVSVDKADMPTHLEYVDDGSGWDKEFAN